MPIYTFQLAAHLAGRAVSVTAAGGTDVVASGTLDSNARFTATLPVGDYVASAGTGYYRHSSAGTVDRGDLDQLADLSSTYAPQSGIKYGTKRATWATAAPGDQTTTSLQTAMARYLIKPNVRTTRWRVKVRNYDCKNGATGAAHTATNIYVGKHVVGSLGAQTGNFVGGTASTPVTGGFTIPGDGTFYTSPWITDDTLQFDPMTEYVVGIGLANTATTAIFRGATQGYYSTSDNPASSGTVISGVLFDFQIEYEYVGDQRLGLFIGDSITAGNGGDTTKYAPPFLTWPAQVATRQAGTHINAGVGGSKTGDWTNANALGTWGRFDWANLHPDYVIVSLGRNDITASVSLATFQANLESIVANIRAKVGAVPIYLGTVAPRNDTVAGVLSTSAASGVTTLTTTKSLSGGVTIDPDRASATEAVTVSSVSGTGPYTLTLSAATTKAHAANAKVVSSSNEAVRWQYNLWTRTCPLGVQGVMDFDRALVDLTDPAMSTMAPEYVFGDNLHLSLQGMARAAAVPNGRLG